MGSRQAHAAAKAHETAPSRGCEWRKIGWRDSVRPASTAPHADRSARTLHIWPILSFSFALITTLKGEDRSRSHWPAQLCGPLTGAIFPIGLLVAVVLGERLLNNTNPLAKLMGMCVLMVNLLWAVHITLLYIAPTLISLTLGISLGLHWIVFSWIIQHPLGIIHTIARTILITAAWWLFPEHRISAVAGAVVITYLYAIIALRSRRLNTVKETTALSPES